MALTQIFLHIGLPKTGTTFLQESVFPQFGSLQVLRGWHSLRELMAAPPDRRVLITDESLAGLPQDGAWFQSFDGNVRQLATAFPSAGVIIGFRRHDSLVLSLYKQYLHEGGVLPLDRFFSPAGNSLLVPEDLGFVRRVDLLTGHFPRVFVYLMDEIRDDLPGLLRDLGAFLGIDAPNHGDLDTSSRNVGIKGTRQASHLRRFNRLSAALSRISPALSLYSPPLRKMRATPRFLVKSYPGFVRGEPLELPAATRDFLSRDFKDDWEALERLRIELRSNESG